MGALVLGGVALWLTRGSWMPRPADTVTVTPATVAPETVAAPATATPPADKTVTAAIVSAPPGARVVREKDGAVIGMTPFRETWPGGEGVTKLRLELDGYRTEAVVGAARSRRRPVVRAAQDRAAGAAQAQGDEAGARGEGLAGGAAASRPGAEIPTRVQPVPL